MLAYTLASRIQRTPSGAIPLRAEGLLEGGPCHQVLGVLADEGEARLVIQLQAQPSAFNSQYKDIAYVML
jgi:hypothetical protein